MQADIIAIAIAFILGLGARFVALPPLVFFFFLQRQFVSGLTLGAQKG